MVITAKDREQEKEEGREKNGEKQPGKDREEEQRTKKNKNAWLNPHKFTLELAK